MIFATPMLYQYGRDGQASGGAERIGSAHGRHNHHNLASNITAPHSNAARPIIIIYDTAVLYAHEYMLARSARGGISPPAGSQAARPLIAPARVASAKAHASDSAAGLAARRLLGDTRRAVAGRHVP